jgi:hypothetical protein
MKYTGNGGSGWEAVGSAGFSTGEAYYTSIAIDRIDTPYVVYRDSGSITVMKFNGNDWENLGSARFAAEASTPSIAIDNSGTPYVVYPDISNGYKPTVMKYTGKGSTGWENVDSEGLSVATVRYPSIAIDSHGIPYVGFVPLRDRGLPPRLGPPRASPAALR